MKNEQLAALTTLAAGAAHELNTPLGTIALVAHELELACNRDGDDSMQDDARLIRREVDRCRDILSRMRLDLGEDFSCAVPFVLAISAIASAKISTTIIAAVLRSTAPPTPNLRSRFAGAGTEPAGAAAQRL